STRLFDGMLTPAIRAILIPLSAPQAPSICEEKSARNVQAYLVACGIPSKRKTDARTSAPPETG
ncbi:MAG TPA: hypothetical protein VFS69_05480, partial [Sphingomicrobium sp.]|nr:hypothetical protein [Sphingomicrobium sp.]